MNEQANLSVRIRNAFSAASHSYEQAAALQREVCSRLVERLNEIEHRPQRVLDIGSGTGNAIRALQKQYPKADCVALDFAHAMLQQLLRRSGWFRKPLAVCADANNLPFRDASFDLVFSSLTFQWCKDLSSVFTQVRRVLAAEGLFLFATLGPDTLMELRASWAEVDSGNHVNDFQDMHFVGDALAQAGFVDPVVDVERIVLTFPDVNALLRDLKALGANTVTKGAAAGLTGPRRMQAMQQAYSAFRTDDGLYPATFEVVFAMAKQAKNQHSMQYFSPDSLKNRNISPKA